MDLETIFCHQIMEENLNLNSCLSYLQGNEELIIEYSKWLNCVDKILQKFVTEEEFYVSNIYINNNFTQDDINNFKNSIKSNEIELIKRILFITKMESTHNFDEFDR